jgi:uncharacterized protein YjiS (DUF1127 family)
MNQTQSILERNFIMNSHISSINFKSRPARLSILKVAALWRSRRHLSALTPEQLEDAGITPSQAHAEAARPVWDAPASWKC